MISSEQIVDTPLPPDRNFNYLKNSGINYLLQLSGNDWTNFNESDPGVTILEQLCYALTELGYCQNFPIEDILTCANGQIDFEHQFYLPQNILTSTPVTELDYRKLLIDQLAAVKNVYVYLDIDTDSDTTKNTDNVTDVDTDTVLLTGGMQLYLLTDNRNDESTLTNHAALELQALQILNLHRNLGQWFKPPKVLSALNITLSGTVQLADGVSISDMQNQMLLALDNFVSPTVCQYGYQALTDQGESADAIFNGPLLLNGWIPDHELATEKLQQITLNAVTALLSSLDGVRSVKQLSMSSTQVSDEEQTCIEIELESVALFTIDKLQLQQSPGADSASQIEQQLDFDLLSLQQQHQAAKIGASVDLAPDLPTGRYREIADYYSVQNTFPADYGIGHESVPVGSSQYRVAQSRQLKGYLMVFDQLLANQFSQLAELGQLFSFNGASTVTDAPGKSYNGIPYQPFSPSYFSQPLYNVPDVQPLLLGNQMYRFDPQPITTLVQQEKIWQQYQQNPFNRYIDGLHQSMESDAGRDDRRNRMLDHLLARHGHSAAWLDNIIHTARWYGSTLKTRIIVKSLLLKNYQLLSYYQPKGYSNLMADKIGSVGRYRLTDTGFCFLEEFGVKAGSLNRFVNFGCASRKKLIRVIDKKSDVGQLKLGWNKEKIQDFNQRCLVIEDGNEKAVLDIDALWSDGQLNLDALAGDLGFSVGQTINFASVEMQLNLLLGLKQHYQWLAQILVSLINSHVFLNWLEGDQEKVFDLTESEADLQICVKRTNNIDQVFFGRPNEGRPMISIAGIATDSLPDHKSYQAYLEQIQWLGNQRQGALLLEPALWLARVNKKQKGALKGSSQSDCYLRTVYVLPDYINLFASATAFDSSLKAVVEHYWPVPIENTLQRKSFADMTKLIHHYINWHNGQRKPARNSTSETYKQQCAAPLAMAKLLGFCKQSGGAK